MYHTIKCRRARKGYPRFYVFIEKHPFLGDLCIGVACQFEVQGNVWENNFFPKIDKILTKTHIFGVFQKKR